MTKFERNFLLGSVTAAHQVEGNNIYSDYWVMEHMKTTSFNEPSLDACDHYNRYEEDIRLLANANLNTYRFSIEWARIEPKEGKFDKNEIAHYRNVLNCCHKNGIEPIVCLHHFTSPIWLIKKGGWEKKSTIKYFSRYCKYVAEQLGDLMHYVITINEANIGLQIADIAERYKRLAMEEMKKSKENSTDGSVQVGINLEKMIKNMGKQKIENLKIFGRLTPQIFHNPRTEKGDMIIIKAHLEAKDAIKALKPNLQVGLSLSLHDIQAVGNGQQNALKYWDKEFTHYLPFIKNDDFFCLQNYSRSLIDESGILPVPEGNEITMMKYEYYPEGLENVIRRVDKEFLQVGKKMPILIGENGIATTDDNRRIDYIKTATDGVKACIDDDIDVFGYLYWSLLDNFEWQKGFDIKFGLIEVDRKTQTRKPKDSLYYLGSLIKK